LVDNGDICSTLWGCLKFTVSYGFQNGGGVGDTFAHTTGVRLILDLTFFCIVLVILLNVIFGMIIDTFSSLRAEKDKKLKDTQEICFICGIDKQIFDRASDEPDGFRSHIRIDHNMWNYLYFIFLLWEQDKDDDDGLEQYIRRSIAANEIVWFPINKAVRLDQIISNTEVLRGGLRDSVSNMDSMRFKQTLILCSKIC
jgi:inositol 1,4,5-triphosphate receptor type 3